MSWDDTLWFNNPYIIYIIFLDYCK